MLTSYPAVQCVTQPKRRKEYTGPPMHAAKAFFFFICYVMHCTLNILFNTHKILCCTHNVLSLSHKMSCLTNKMFVSVSCVNHKPCEIFCSLAMVVYSHFPRNSVTRFTLCLLTDKYRRPNKCGIDTGSHLRGIPCL